MFYLIELYGRCIDTRTQIFKNEKMIMNLLLAENNILSHYR